jgi:hypothetical protein
MVTIPNGISRDSVTKAQLDNGPATGLQWGALGAGMIPVFEEQAARLERNLTLEQWGALDPMERALLIAQRRIDAAIRAVQDEAAARQVKRKAKK